MNKHRVIEVSVILILVARVAAAVNWFVATNGNDSADGTNWIMAKASIQAAIDVATGYDTVWVSNGTYSTGGRPAGGGDTLTNRVTIDKPLTVRSVNGPTNTFIVGFQVPANTNGRAAVRCVWMTNGSSLVGFTLTNGATYYYSTVDSNNDDGGGVWCQSTNTSVSSCSLIGNAAGHRGGGANRGTLYNCTLTGNSAGDLGGATSYSTLYSCTLIGNSASSGGGAYYGTLNNCTLTGNSANHGGGAAYGVLRNCTLTGNSAGWSGGGVQGDGLSEVGTLINCIVVGNYLTSGVLNNWTNVILNYTCTFPMPPDGTGNITNPPLFVDQGSGYGTNHVGGDFRLQSNSACINRGTNQAWMAGATDLDGNPRIMDWIVDMGAYEFEGLWPMSVPRYVVAGNLNAQFPYTNWFGAAANIQDAVDAAIESETIWVTNGVYNSGGRPQGGAHTLSNRVCIDKPVMVRSVNGPTNTFIVGAKVAMTTNGPAAVRCAWLSSGASLIGFTLTNGATHNNVIGDSVNDNGGGVWCQSTNVSVSNCTLIGNSASDNGGGAYNGKLDNCMLTGNSASAGGGAYGGYLRNSTIFNNSSVYGGGAYTAVLSKCTLNLNTAHSDGGGAYGCTLDNCMITANHASVYDGGGAYNSTLYDCNLVLNSAHNDGGGVYNSMLSNCTLAANRAPDGGGAWGSSLNSCVLSNNMAYVGGGAYLSMLNNCTLTSNEASFSGGGTRGGALNNCTLIGNTASNNGGGAYYGTLNSCTLIRNSAGEYGGGAYDAIVIDCAIFCNSASEGGGTYDGTLSNCNLAGNSASKGGGAYGGGLNNCILTSNSAFSGGGTYYGTLNNCIIAGNSARDDSGGVYYGTLNNCTLTGNSASFNGGGTYYGTLNNCITVGNYLTNGVLNNWSNSTYYYSCTWPIPTQGFGNITNAPVFVNPGHGYGTNHILGDYHLQSISPCIDIGDNSFVQGEIDLDGNPRIAYGRIDMGVYEAQLVGGYAIWAEAITNGLKDATDCLAGDGVPNLLKYATGSSPRNSDELAQLDGTASNGIPVLVFNRNPNATDITLVIQRATTISNGVTWLGVATNINGSWSGATNVYEFGMGNPVTCKVEDQMPFHSNRFLRLKVTRP